MNQTKSARWLPGFIALGIVWGASFLFIKVGLESLTPLGVAFWRGAIGGIALLAFAVATRTKLPAKLVHWLHLAVIAFLLNSAPGFLFAYGETQVSTVMAGLLNATTPLMTTLVILVAFREQKIDRDQGLGIFVGFVGILFVTGAVSGFGDFSWQGTAALLAATLCYGIAFPYSKRFVAPLPYTSTALATAQVLSSAVLLLPFALVFGTNHSDWNAGSIISMFVLGALGTGFAYIWNFRNIKLAGSTIASTVTYITPVVAVVLGVLFLGEALSLNDLIGGLLVLLSAMLVQKRLRILTRRRRPAESGR